MKTELRRKANHAFFVWLTDSLSEECGISNAKLAQMLGVTDQTVSNWRRDHYEVPAPVAILLRSLAGDPEKLVEHLKKGKEDMIEQEVTIYEERRGS